MTKVFLQRFFSKGDKLSTSWGMESIYFSKPLEVSGNNSQASVWHCHSLKSSPWIDTENEIKLKLEQHAHELVSEYHAATDKIGTHPDNDDYVDNGKWNGLFISGTSGEIDKSLLDYFPTTAQIISELPICYNFGFIAYSQLTPGTHIVPHVGSSNLRVRYHLGIDIPEPEKVKIRVGDEWRCWTQNGVIAFDDSYNHEVIHEGTKDRAVLIVDVWHPSLSNGDMEVLSNPVFSSFGK
ncbi:MAG: aspartyl/asparaginyl beta-hydroxylase domain-containing protein [Halioglobus sp.]